MSIDPYAPCPCGSGKKLKFCCSDLAGDLEKIEKLISGEQPHAALRHIERLLAKQPERTSLLDLQASLELSLGELDQAQETIQKYLQLDPEHPSAYGLAAILAAGKGETAAAVGALQAAWERLGESSVIPLRLYEALGAVGHTLLVEGDLVAARAHLTLHAAIAPEGDTQGMELLVRLNLEGRPPTLLREQLRPVSPPEDAPWADACREANSVSVRGLWQRAEADYVRLLEETSPESAPQVVYNLALVRGWLGDTPRFAAGLREYARLDVPWEDAVEAMALAETVDSSNQDTLIETCLQSHSLANDDEAIEKLLAESRAMRLALDTPGFDETEGKPRETFMLLDRPTPPSYDGIEPDDVPRVLGLAAVYGKRTDRDAYLTLTAEEGADEEAAHKFIADVLGDLVGEKQDRRVIDEAPPSLAVLQWRWYLPDDLDETQREALRRKRRRQVILDEWVNVPQDALGGKTAIEAAGDPSQKVALASVVLTLQQAATSEEDAALYEELREKLQLPASTTIEPDDVDPLRCPLVRTHRLNFRAVPDELIQRLLGRLTLGGALLATSRAAREIIRRVEEENSDLDPNDAYVQLFQLTGGPGERLDIVARAKAWAEQHGRDTSEWALMELNAQLQAGDPQGIAAAMSYLQQHHGRDPKVGEAAVRMLYEAGYGEAVEQQLSPAPAEQLSSSPEPAIWTPDSPPSTPSGKGSSAIWTP